MKLPAEQQILSLFDYSTVEPEKAKRAREAVTYIASRNQSVAVTIIEIGKRLVEVRADLGHGLWGPWLEAHFGWTDRTARNYMAAGQALGDKAETVSDLPINTVYKLARASEPVRERVLLEMQAARQEARPLAAEQVSWRIGEAGKEEKQERARAKQARARAKLSPEQLAKEKAREKARKSRLAKALREYEEMRREQQARLVEEEKGLTAAADLIRERFRDDLPVLVELVAKAGRKLDEMRVRLEAPYGTRYADDGLQEAQGPTLI